MYLNYDVVSIRVYYAVSTKCRLANDRTAFHKSCRRCCLIACYYRWLFCSSSCSALQYNVNHFTSNTSVMIIGHERADLFIGLEVYHQNTILRLNDQWSAIGSDKLWPKAVCKSIKKNTHTHVQANNFNQWSCVIYVYLIFVFFRALTKEAADESACQCDNSVCVVLQFNVAVVAHVNV